MSIRRDITSAYSTPVNDRTGPYRPDKIFNISTVSLLCTSLPNPTGICSIRICGLDIVRFSEIPGAISTLLEPILNCDTWKRKKITSSKTAFYLFKP